MTRLIPVSPVVVNNLSWWKAHCAQVTAKHGMTARGKKTSFIISQSQLLEIFTMVLL